MLRKLFGIFSGALLGYAAGWILGWSAFDPNLDLWALLAGVGVLAGLLVGLTPLFWCRAGLWFGGAAGLYLGWLLRTLLFGDVPGGPGLLCVLGGALLGGLAGSRPAFQEGRRPLRILMAAVYIGFFGGFLVDVVLLDLVLKLVQSHTVLSQAPAVLLCAAAGGGLAAWQRPGAPAGPG